MYLKIENIWCIIWNVVEFTGMTFGFDISWLFGKAIGCRRAKQLIFQENDKEEEKQK